MTTGDHAELADLITRLIRRDHRPAQPLPLLCLIYDAETPSPVENLARRLHAPAGRRRVRFARPNLTTLTADPERGDTPADGRLPALLRALRRELSSNTSGPDPLVCRRLHLAQVLMRQTIDVDAAEDVHDESRVVAGMLREQFGYRWAAWLLEHGRDIHGLSGLVYNIILLLPRCIVWIRTSGVIPGLGREFRWFVRQPFMTPTLSSGGFRGFAPWLTAPRRAAEDPVQVQMLLVHAFLEDLRQAYRSRPWRLRAWRRTAHPVVLLTDAAPATGEPDDLGATLLRLINDVRNATGLLDPLVVVYAAPTVPSAALRPLPGPPPPATEAAHRYAVWKDALERRDWRLRAPSAWYLPLTVTTPALDAPGDPVGSQGRITPGRPPWWSHRAVPIAVCLALVAGLTSWGASAVVERCGTVLSQGRVAIQRVQSGSASGTATTPASCSATTATPARDRSPARPS
ncbi:hypothetical protein [Frankia sp. CiP3]|uniref:hypothetical protein n=1 Tax=Frankia sp. CiP3 TaxID=2880971 RepID=UPI001EF6C8C6|nr:hypothetical protein [Frankia sp. CiP3]